MEAKHPLGPLLQPMRLAIHSVLAKLPPPLEEFILFGLKMAWSCLFGGAFLALLILTHFFWPKDFILTRYDFLFCAAIIIQILMLVTKLETFEEVKVITLYHIIGTIMEIFKTHMGSWEYPESSIIHIGGVPLFTGFMYGTVGSFMARAIRVFDMRFEPYPKYCHTYILAGIIYLNFFTHHYIWDFRYLIFMAIAALYWKTQIYYRPHIKYRKMPLLLSAFLSSFFLWLAENIGTFTRTWIYPHQADGGWHLVRIEKMGAWFLLLFISFTTVTLVVKPKGRDGD